MFSPYKRPIVRDDSDSDEEVRAPRISPRKRPLIRDGSDSNSEDVPLESPCKRMRRIILDDEDEEDVVVERPTRQEPAMEDEHHKLLLTSLTTSQQASASTVRHIRTEVLFTLLENVDAVEILDYRLLSRRFKKEIDTHVLHHHIQRVGLIRYLGPKEDQLFEYLNAKDYWDFAFVKASFDCLDDKEEGRAIWDPQGATFRIEKSLG